MPKHSTISRRLHPRLRVIENGSGPVNACRSGVSTKVAAARAPDFAADEKEIGLDIAALQWATSNLASGSIVPEKSLRRPGLPARTKKETNPPPDSSFVNVVIDVMPAITADNGDDSAERAATERVLALCEAALDRRSAPITAAPPLVRGNQVSATVPVTALRSLMDNSDVSFVGSTDSVKLDIPEAEPAQQPSERKIGRASDHKDGADIIIGIIDVGGFDFSHPDFLDHNGHTRFSYIWDQGGEFRAPPKKFEYGAEFTADHMNAALEAEAGGALPAVLLEPQSQRAPSSHATHVASIAAGNSGICPKAEIVGVLIDVPRVDDDYERRKQTFSDSSRIIHAVEYLLDIAKARGKRISINVSLGTNGGGHDGLASTNRWLDNALSTPGRAITLAAGNAGQEKAEDDEDFGWIMGRIHTTGRIPSRGLESELEWTVVGNGIADISENELEIWYSPQDRFRVEVLPPMETNWLSVEPQHFIENKRLRDGTTVSIYNELFHPSNGENYISVYLSPNLDPGQIRGIRAGVWRVRLIGEEVRNGRFHCWIERDDPHEFGVHEGQRIFRFPSFFSASTNVDSHSISSLACGRATIAVSNYDSVTNKMNVTSSQGPTRDGRQKPDVAAPGTNIVAAKGFSDDGELWVSMSGTSMASPYVAGVVGLMMNAASDPINSLQCLGILLRTAHPLPGGQYDWVNDAGFGRIDPEAAISEAKDFSRRTDKT